MIEHRPSIAPDATGASSSGIVLSEFEESAERVDPSEYETARSQTRKWIAAGAAAILLVGVVIGLTVRARNYTQPKTATGPIDWKLSVFSNNKIDFRPSLITKFPPRALDTR